MKRCTFAIDAATLSELVEYRAQLERETPGLRLSLSSTARALIRRGLRGERARQAGQRAEDSTS